MMILNIWLVVSSQLKNISQNGNHPLGRGEKKKKNETTTQKRNFLFKDLWGFYSLQYIWRVGGVDPKNGQVTQGSLLQLQATTLSLIKKDMLLFIERILRQYNLVKMTIYIVSIRLNNMLTCRFLIHQHYHSRHPKTSQFSDFSCISLG